MECIRDKVGPYLAHFHWRGGYASEVGLVYVFYEVVQGLGGLVGCRV